MYSMRLFVIPQLKHMFSFWKQWTNDVGTFRTEIWKKRARYSLLLWYSRSKMRKRLRIVHQGLVSSQTRNCLQYYFRTWTFESQVEGKLRMAIQPKKCEKVLKALRRRLFLSKMGYIRICRSFIFFKINAFRNVFCKLRKNLQTTRQIESAYFNVRYLTNKRTKSIFFSYWTIESARKINLSRKENAAICLRFRSLLWYSFFAWFHMYERSKWIRHSHRERLAAHSIQMKYRMRQVEANIVRNRKGLVLRQWARVIRCRRGGLASFEIFFSNLYKRHILNYFRRWFLVTNLHVVLACIQKYWRGYRCRFLATIRRSGGSKRGVYNVPPGQLYRYLTWYRSKIPLMSHFREKWLKLRLLRRWHRVAFSMRFHFIRDLEEKMLKKAIKSFNSYIARRQRTEQEYWAIGTGTDGTATLRFPVSRALSKLQENGQRRKVHCVVISYSCKSRIRYLLRVGMEMWSNRHQLKKVSLRLATKLRLDNKGKFYLRKLRMCACDRHSRRRRHESMCQFAATKRMQHVYSCLRLLYNIGVSARRITSVSTAVYVRRNLMRAFTTIKRRYFDQERRSNLFVRSGKIKFVGKEKLEGGHILSKAIAKLYSRRVLKFLFSRVQKRKKRREYRRKLDNDQCYFDQLRGFQVLRRFALIQKNLMQLVRISKFNMRKYRMYMVFKRIFLLPFKSHGLRAVTTNMKSRVEEAFQSLYYRTWSNRETVDILFKAASHHERKKRCSYFIIWYDRCKDQIYRRERNSGRLNVWEYTMKKYYLRVLYRVLATRRRFRMICFRFKLKGSMDKWAVTAARSIR